MQIKNGMEHENGVAGIPQPDAQEPATGPGGTRDYPAGDPASGTTGSQRTGEGE